MADLKINNILVNSTPPSQSTSTQRFTDGQLADLESTVHVTSGFCKDRDEIDVPPEKLRPFSLASQKEISQQDKEFLLKIMKLDPRDRPTAKDLIEDEWFNQ
ncbi:hypothetical protein APSETT444_003633 [Aspergillus pseudonomiae]